MKREKWVWMPHPGHFICSRDCQFFLNTYVGGYIVSTVGELWFDRDIRKTHAKIYDEKWYLENKDLMGDIFDNAYKKRFGYEDLHSEGWKYETMIFKAGKSQNLCCHYSVKDYSDVQDEKCYKTAEEAMKGHYQFCKKYS